MTANVKPGLVATFLNSFFPPILIFLALAIGTAALFLTPREEDPQIIVPMADVLIQAPGLSPQQVENQVTQPLEKLLTQIDGVEDVYSTSMKGAAQVIVRFYVGEQREEALIKLYNKIYSNLDLVPPSVTQWAVKPIEIDDVPIVVAALYSTAPELTGNAELRRIAEQAVNQLQALDNTNKVAVVGGNPRVIQIELDSVAMASRMTTVDDIQQAFSLTNQHRQLGDIHQQGRVFELESGQFVRNARDVAHTVVNVVNGQPVYLQDIATVTDGPDEAENQTWFRWGMAAEGDNQGGREPYPAVFLSIAKQKGSNAVWVADDAIALLEEMVDTQFPPHVNVSVIRNYGETANEKVGNLVSSLGLSILTVVVFVGVFLNWRSALVVGIAIPISYGAALGMDFLFGYTINRVTLFALILALGLIVDDPIASIDNIERFLKRKGLAKSTAIVMAMAEIRSALLMSTVAIVIVFTPMFFITGMMGPYMAPLAFNVPISVIFSTVVAFLITPWLAKKLLKAAVGTGHYRVEQSLLYRIYDRMLSPLLARKRNSVIFLSLVALAFVAAAMLPALRIVPLKLLPYDNKNEFQLVLNMPETSSVEQTSNALSRFADYLESVPEVVSVSGFAGIASPMDFNGMVRHYFMRTMPYQGELRIVLAEKDQRQQQSHEMVTRLRADLTQIAQGLGADIQLVETPPGPPVIATIVAEVYGQPQVPYHQLQDAAGRVAERLAREPFVAETDTSIEGEKQSWRFVVDAEKAALSGVSVQDINQTLAAANQGRVVSYLYDEHEINPLPITMRLPGQQRDDLAALENLYVRGMPGIAKRVEQGRIVDAGQPLVQLSELGYFERLDAPQPIMRKNLRQVVYVFAEATGRVPAEVIADVSADLQGDQGNGMVPSDRNRPLSARTYLSNGGGDHWQLPPGTRVVWSGEGEWKITLDVFRDLGIAYGAALLGVFVVMVLQTGLPAVSGIIMLAIPLTVIGIMPGFWLLNLLGTTEINGIPNPALFTATAMIGMIALAGIVVRNSLVLIQFIHQSLRDGDELKAALLKAGAVRMRPILLTAGTTLLGNVVITLDPIFNGLAWAIIFGITASTLFTLLVIPVVYHLAYANKPGHGLPADSGGIPEGTLLEPSAGSHPRSAADSVN
ncbi:efflux RND transporter permease subunit [Photobacterium rosenbergii]|uniref:Efflux RND transporter permease subunit n=1 Tax=Photobacterium rosenbergii TaxID=294936 RepID=A0ABU3ZE90_9GAMM|nr:efflux RND transporter permease subunit [Photobacterium rosenbergii]MDV5168424.1 efflux RND transporter permease subunit [Photobacterium rosenbergii]